MTGDKFFQGVKIGDLYDFNSNYKRNNPCGFQNFVELRETNKTLYSNFQNSDHGQKSE